KTDSYQPSYLVKSAAVGGPSTQLMSHAPSTVMNVSEFMGNHASCTIFAGMKLNPPGPISARLPSHASVAVPLIIVCDSLAVCQCLRTWIAFGVRMSRLVACVFGSIWRMLISGESAPRSGKILSHLRSERFLNSGAFTAASGEAIGIGSAARLLSKKLNVVRIARYNFVFMDYESDRIHAITRILKLI